jgi:hypothetical protein
MRTISAKDAIKKMRELSKLNESFSLQFYTWDRSSETTSGLKTVRCRLRKALSSENFSLDADHYLAYTDLSNNLPRLAWKRLLRNVDFGQGWVKIDWYSEYRNN